MDEQLKDLDIEVRDIEGSSLLSGEGYHEERQTLRIRYPNGSEYHHYPVTPDMYADFQAAESKGKWAHANLRGKECKVKFHQVVPPTPKDKR